MLSNRLGLALPSNDAKALFEACADDLLGKVRAEQSPHACMVCMRWMEGGVLRMCSHAW